MPQKLLAWMPAARVLEVTRPRMRADVVSDRNAQVYHRQRPRTSGCAIRLLFLCLDRQSDQEHCLSLRRCLRHRRASGDAASAIHSTERWRSNDGKVEFHHHLHFHFLTRSQGGYTACGVVETTPAHCWPWLIYFICKSFYQVCLEHTDQPTKEAHLQIKKTKTTNIVSRIR